MRVSNTEKFIEKANIIHSNKYNYSLVNYKNANTKVKIICEEHNEFEQTPYKHLKKQGCPKCGGRVKFTTEDFIKYTREIHDDKYNYSLVNYKNINSKVKIICEEHGEFEQVSGTHIYNKSGCPKCQKNYKCNTDVFIKKANTIHNNKYDYSLVNYINTTTKIKIICDKHGEFEQTPNHHLNHQGCPICGNNIKMGEYDFIKNAKLSHNETYDYSMVEYINNRTKIKIICKKHGIFEQCPTNNISKTQGCPKCKSNSKGEDTIEKILTEKNIYFEQQKKFENCKNTFKLPFDFYIPKYNLIIEYDGRQHFNINTKFYTDKIVENDNIKNIFCEKNNINLLRINYTENIIEKIEKTIYKYEKI